MSLNIVNKFKLFDVFASMYEVFNPLTTVNPQHFVEWFSGSVLDSIWTFADINAGGSGAMADAIDGGFQITPPPGTLDISGLAFNGKHQYNFDASILIAIGAKVILGGRYRIALADGVNISSSTTSQIGMADVSGNIDFVTSDGATNNTTATTVAANTTNPHVFKLQTFVSSNTLDIEGVLEATRTTFLPGVKLQPVFNVRAGGPGSETSLIRYLEAFNT